MALATSLLGAASSMSTLWWPFASAFSVFSGPEPECVAVPHPVTIAVTGFASLSAILKTNLLAVEARLKDERTIEGT